MNKYRVFIGPQGARTLHGTYRTKLDAVNALFTWLNMRHFNMPEDRENTARATNILIADKERILKERFRPMPSGLHGPLYTFPLGSIAN